MDAFLTLFTQFLYLFFLVSLLLPKKIFTITNFFLTINQEYFFHVILYFGLKFIKIYNN